MSLRTIAYQEDYRSGEHDILEDFFHPSLRTARKYWRAVGYFSSSALESFGAPLDNFVRSGGSIRLVTSVELSEEDLLAIDQGLNKQEFCEKRIEQIIDEQFVFGVGNGVARLGALLKTGRLEIKIAVPEAGLGIYHEKVGIFIDSTGYVAFSGSANESRSAFENNYECLDVFTSWDKQSRSRASNKLQHFIKLWENRADGAIVFPFPEAAAKKLIRICDRIKTKDSAELSASKKWRHQDEAVANFLEAERGVLDMATGTGKTRTALKIITELLNSDLIDTIIIATYGNDLLDQWYKQLLAFGSEQERKLVIYRHYGSMKDRLNFVLDPDDAVLLTSRAALTSPLRAINRSRGDRTLLVHDEVHGLGSPANRRDLSGLSQNIRFRLGLSATPEREYDQEGNDFIEEHIGPVLVEFGLQEAIERGILAPFDYFPLQYEITKEDKDKIQGVFARQAARKRAGNPMRDEDVWMEIARIYKASRAKIPIFEEFISGRPDLLRRSIIFTETHEYGREILEIVHKYRADFHTYFSGEDSKTLQRFATGALECLITCHRLSEGIDIKSLRSVMLFSSARARLETIQRIGRCLRTDPNDPEKFANIVDFIRDSGDGNRSNADTERQVWLDELSTVRPLG